MIIFNHVLNIMAIINIIMKIQVYDTYVKRKDGKTMHFDVFLDDSVGDERKALDAAKKYLIFVGETEATITSKECNYCHIQEATDEQVKAIDVDGYFIYKMSVNCL